MKPSWFFSGLVTLLMVPAAYSADVNRSWDTLVETLKTGRRVVVVQHNRKQAEGKLLSLTNESITVQVRGQPLAVPREDVFRVRIADIRARNTAIGMGIGTVAGAVIYVLGTNADPAISAMIGAILGVGPGAAVGGAMPIGKPLYEAPGGLRKSGN